MYPSRGACGAAGRDSVRGCHSGHLPIVARETAGSWVAELDGQVALVTGASKGIGRAIAAVVRRRAAPR